MHQPASAIEQYSDAAVIEKIVAGEMALFEVLIRRYNPVLYKIARSYSFNHQDAEDLLQETHLAAYLALKKFEGRSTYKTWISRIMVNKCLYKLRYGYYRNEFPAAEGPGEEAPLPATRKETPPEAVLLNRELSVVLEKSLQNIPVNYRTAFVLREVEGFSVAETAELLDITPVNVKVRVNRAKALLQKQIEQFYSRADLFPFHLVYCDGIVHRVFAGIRLAGGAPAHGSS